MDEDGDLDKSLNKIKFLKDLIDLSRKKGA